MLKKNAVGLVIVLLASLGWVYIVCTNPDSFLDFAMMILVGWNWKSVGKILGLNLWMLLILLVVHVYFLFWVASLFGAFSITGS